MTTVVITGASGFLGRHLVHKLAQNQQHRVVAVSRTNVQLPLGVTNVCVAHYDELMPEVGSTLIHLAEANSTLQDESDEAAQNLLDKLLAKPFARVIYASSATVYGDQNTNANRVGDEIRPTSSYARSKFLREQAVIENGGTVLRIGNVYGPGMSQANVLSDILAQMNTSGPILVRNDTPVRDYIYIEDVVSAFIAVLALEAPGIFNIGTGTGYSVRALAELILSLAEQQNRDIIATNPTAAFSKLVLDIEDTMAKTGWKPKFSLMSGVKRLLNT